MNEIAQSSKVDQIQVLSWNDYEGDSQLESGIDNCVTIVGSVSGSNLSWTTTGTVATVDHYAIWASTDGVNVNQVGNVAGGGTHFDLSTAPLISGTQYSLFIQAVGKPSVQNKISTAVTYFAPSRKAPSVSLTVTPSGGPAPLPITAKMTSVAAAGKTILSNSISFGDGSTVNGTTGSHAYANAGTFTVTARATDNAGLSSATTSTVTVTSATTNQPPIAKLAVTPTSGAAPLAVSASTAGSTDPDGTIASTSIDFGDGTTVPATSASHTYSAAGSFVVKATVIDNKGASSSTSTTVSVTATPVTNKPPIAKLSVTPTSGTAPMTVNASSAGSSDPDGTIARTSIDFGDGTVANSASASHSYSTAGSFTVRATVTDNGGASSSATATVTVSGANQPPIAKLSVTPVSGTTPLSVTASTAGSSDPDGTIASIKIDFGDGTVVNAGSGSHTYAAAGSFTVRATVTDNGGLSSSASTVINVSAPAQPPVASLTVTPPAGTVPLAITTSTAGTRDPNGGTITATVIDFGDGTVVNTPSGSHTYSATGTFTVKATVTESEGLSASATSTVVVSAAPPPPPPGTGFTTHGMTISAGHPRIWWTAARLATAKSWYAAHSFTASSDIDVAWKHVVTGSDCSTAITDALAYNPTNSMDDARWYGSDMLTIFDWCYDQFTPTQRTQFITTANGWVNFWATYSWPPASMALNNYYVSHTRNALLWGMISYGENASAESLVAIALDTRWPNIVDTAVNRNGAGGVAVEGEQYDQASMEYLIRTLDATHLFGRDLTREIPYWRDMVYWTIYSTTPALTFASDLTSYAGSYPPSAWMKAPFNDDQYWIRGGAQGVYSSCRAFMLYAANNWNGTNTGGYAQTWWNNVGGFYDGDSYNGTAETPTYIKALNGGVAAKAFSSLPLDYYASGLKYLYTRKAWDSTSAWLTVQMGSYQQTDSSHTHLDVGSFNFWRGGRWLTRESAGYGTYDGSASDPRTAGYHNVLLVNGAGPSSYTPTSNVRRLESAAAYTYADVDLSPFYGSNHVEREFLFLRDIETLVVLDRINTASSSTPRTFILHSEVAPSTDNTNHTVTITNGSQVLFVKTLLPASTTYTVSSGEADTTQSKITLNDSGSTQTYFLNVLQARTSTSGNLNPTLVDNGASYTVTLDATHSLSFNKGTTSTGGSVTINGATSNLRTDVQAMKMSDSGPQWQP